MLKTSQRPLYFVHASEPGADGDLSLRLKTGQSFWWTGMKSMEAGGDVVFYEGNDGGGYCTYTARVASKQPYAGESAQGNGRWLACYEGLRALPLPVERATLRAVAPNLGWLKSPRARATGVRDPQDAAAIRQAVGL